MNPSHDFGTLAAIAAQVDGRVVGDPSVRITRIAAIDDVDATTLTFATDERYLRAALDSRAAAVLVANELVAAGVVPAKPLVVVASPRLALSALLAALEPPRPRGPFVHPTAVIDPSATLGADVYVGPYVVIEAGATIGARSVLGAGVVIGAHASVGADAHFHPRAYLAGRCIAGDRVVLHPGAVVGSDGFGWAFLDGALRKIPQVGIVELADDVEIGANACVDRAQTGVTAIGRGAKIDNLVQIGHNSRVGAHTAIAAQTGLAGTTTIGDYTQVGGQAGFGGHVQVGSRVRVAGGSHVWGDIPDGATVSGEPARNHRDNLRLQAYIRRLPKLFDRVDTLERNDAARRD